MRHSTIVLLGLLGGCDDTVTVYPDRDQDGYGDPELAIDLAPDAPLPEGYTREDGDCDDDNPNIHPNGEEVCNGQDDDCDELVDDADDSLSGGLWAWYRDRDRDGHGDPGEVLEACAQPEGYALMGDDCDDRRRWIHPGAEEVCDGRDSSCDGVIPDEEVDDDGDGFVECPLEKHPTLRGGDCDDANPARHPGAEEICNDGVANDCDAPTWQALETCTMVGALTPEDAALTLHGEESHDRLGTSICAAGDINGDGYDDFVTGAYTHGGGDGMALLVYGRATQGSEALSGEDVDVLMITLGDYADSDGDGEIYLGENCVGGQDLTGDGVPDVVLGAHYADTGERSNQGMACVLSGAWLQDQGSSASLSDSDEHVVCIYGESSGDHLSMLDGLYITDFDRDGQADLALGAVGAGSGNDGRVYFIAGPISRGFGGPHEANVVVDNDGRYAYMGRTFGSADLDGDGWPELLTGGGGSSTPGYALGLEANSWANEPLSLTLEDSVALAIEAPDASTNFGRTGLTAGDLTGDGISEVVVSATAGGASEEGQVFIFDGAYLRERTHSTPLDPSAATYFLEGDLSGGRVGMSPKILPDMNGDGIPELLIGNNAPSTGGEALLIYGGQLYSGLLHDAPLRFIDDGYSAHYHGREISPIGDFNGDGVQDLAVGAYHWSGGELAKQGAVYVYLGRGI
ncbi:MAG: FG-GAP repeat protein [Alphaproteobacteria bacterium]|nr:FG-GAP repeat protein [Alphaproteobacteria bacterium]